MSKQDQRALILDQARALFLEEGAKGLSMRNLAKLVGVTPGAIYWHFKNKEELVREIFLEGVHTFSRYLSRSLTGKDPLERLMFCAEAFLAFGLEQPSHYDVFFLNRTPQVDEPVVEQLSMLRRGNFQLLIDRIRECRDAGLLRQDIEVDRVAVTMLSSCLGLMTMYRYGYLGTSREHFEQIYRNTFESMLSLLKA